MPEQFKKILIVEDEPSLVFTLKDTLEAENYEVVVVSDGNEVVDAVKSTEPDLMILDLMLPNRNGYEICEEIRSLKYTFPIIMLTARDQEIDKVTGLNIGADDYMVKPISMDELMLKIRNLSTRISKISGRGTVQSFNDGALVVRPLFSEVMVDAKEVVLTQNELTMLMYLIDHAGMTLSRESILENCLNNEDVYDRVVDVHIKNLRKKLGDSKKNPRFVATIYGGGYKFVGEKDA